MSRISKKMKKEVLRASEAAIAKKKRVLERLKKKEMSTRDACLVFEMLNKVNRV